MAAASERPQSMSSWLSYGLNFADIELEYLTRKVLHVSVAVAAVVVLNHFAFRIAGQAIFGFPQRQRAVILLLMAVSVPACGYFGARKNNLALMCCFTGVSFATALFFACWFVIILLLCARAAGTPSDAADGSDLVATAGEDDDLERRPTRRDLGLLLYILVYYAVMLVLKAMSVIWGFRLFQKLREGVVLVVPPGATAAASWRAEARRRAGAAGGRGDGRASADETRGLTGIGANSFEPSRPMVRERL